MKKKLLVLLIAVIPTLMPNLVSAVAIDPGGCYVDLPPKVGLMCDGCLLWCLDY